MNGIEVDETGDEAGSPQPLVLRYSHHVIEHLGLKLYQNRPTNVVAELVSNGWDASAGAVWIHLNTSVAQGDRRYLAVGDDGTGMTLSDLADSYLVIGKPKNRAAAHQAARYPMGRKGIGKLAPFGIARTVEVITAAKRDGRVTFNWLRIELPKILELGHQTPVGEQAIYPPVPIVTDGDATLVRAQPDSTGEIAKFLDRIEARSGTGTLILMSNLSLLREIAAQPLRQAMGRRFTVTLARADFEVEVDGVRVTDADALPEFEHRIPEQGMQEETVGDRKVKYWVGFVKTASWPSDEAGVGVYAHGKIAQDRPFTFGVKGKEIFTRYMYAVVEADFLDELEEDVISTDRRSVDWEHPLTAALHDWGQRKVRIWIEDYRSARRKTEVVNVRDHIDRQIAAGKLPKIRDDEKAVISDLLAEVTPGLDKDIDQYDRVTAAIMKAYLHRPTREILKKVWADYAKGNGDPQPFLDMADKIAAAAIPEALSLAVIFAQRAYALSVLSDMQHSATEPDLQKLIEKFPWILQPEMELLTANQRLKTLVESAHSQGLSPSRFSPGHVEVNDAYKPDFVFFSDIQQKQIVVAEIKTPREDLNFKNREQLAAYMVYLEQQYPDAIRKGFLVGSNGQKMARGREDIEILSWTDVFLNSRRGHIDMLAAMLATANPDADDDRIAQIVEFGGEEVWELLSRVATNDDNLADLVDKRPRLLV